MKKSALAMICLASIAFSGPTLADRMPAGTMSMSKALTAIKAKGYSIVKKASYDDGMYTFEGISEEGKEEKIKMNAKTGEIVSPKETKDYMTALEIAKKVESEGYSKIFKIDTEWFKNKYEVKAFNQDGRKVKLNVNATTGEIKID